VRYWWLETDDTWIAHRELDSMNATRWSSRGL